MATVSVQYRAAGAEAPRPVRLTQEFAMSDVNEQKFQGYSDNHYQHGMHGLAWVSLWLIVGLGVAAGVFGFIYGSLS